MIWAVKVLLQLEGQARELCDPCEYLYRYHKLFCLVAIVLKAILPCLVVYNLLKLKCDMYKKFVLEIVH